MIVQEICDTPVLINLIKPDHERIKQVVRI